MNLPANNDVLLKSFPELRRTTCPYCGVGCGVDAKLDFTFNEAGKVCGELLSVTGTPEHPANYGRLCVKGSKLVESNGLDGRLLQPAVNGENVSWTDAISTVADGFSDVIAKHGSDAVAFYVSGQLLTEDYYVANKLMKGYIGSANIDTNSRLCMSSAVAGYKRAFGSDSVPCCYEDLERTQLLILVGSNLAWAHPVLYQRVERAKQLNPAMKIIVVDPRRTATCEIADLHLAIKPGSDVALFNGLLRYLEQTDNLDNSYIENYTNGFSDCLDAARLWCPERVAEFCDISLSDLLSFFKACCKSDSAVTLYSMGVNQSTSGVDKSNAIINFHLATGKIGKVGAGPFSITGQPNAMGGREVGGLANMLAAHMDIENDSHRELVQRFWDSPTIASQSGLKALDLIEKIEAGEVKALWVMATNPLMSLPDRNRVATALQKCELLVVSDCVASNDTLAFAHVALPATGWSEKNGTVTNSERRISRQRGLMCPAGESKHDWQIICEVAKKMGFNGFDYHNAHDIFNEHIELSGFANYGTRDFDISGLGHLTLSQYDNLAPVQWPITDKHVGGTKRMFTDAKFFTANGRANFIALTPRLPEQSTDDAYPFILNTGRIRDQWHSMTRTGKAPDLLQHMEKPVLQMHPKDAEKLSVGDGELVRLRGKMAGSEAIYHCQLDAKQRKGELFAPMHWNREFGSHCNVNTLVQAVGDPISGQPELKHAAVVASPCKFEHYVMLCVRKPLSAEQLNANTDFWLKQRFSSGYCYLLGVNEAPEDWWQWLTELADSSALPISIQTPALSGWLTVNDDSESLAMLVWISTRLPEVKLDWFEHVFNQSRVAETDYMSLLRFEPSDEFKQGRLVCSCFSVRENTIKSAIKEGCMSVEQLGQKLQCGTNCGSCKSELSALITDTKREQIEVVSL